MKEIDENEPVFPIGIVAERLGISEHTIRLYEKEGLIIPYKKESGHRLFSQIDMQRIECIKKTIAEKKVSIAGIRRLLALIPCWEIKKCEDEIKINCPAYFDYEKPCWLHKANLKGECATNDCRQCPVYNSIRSCSELKELLKKFMQKTSI
ncbi:MAG: MerR family transcriptional regulator [Candidatus Kryptonium sp.]|nr:MerR family transcriptional regulator [Candidatus Kryptonium sp.]MDW8109130.1 MerR family transcriptional regulator [Candidatus Kryptonium sp.]